MPVKESADVKVGQSVFTIGYPNIELQGSNPKTTKGEISSIPTQNVNYALKSAYLLPLISEQHIKTPSKRKGWFPKSFESIVQDAQDSVVMILVY